MSISDAGQRRSNALFLFLIAAPAISLAFDIGQDAPTNWFQRSGAFLILAGIQLQFSRLQQTWSRALQRERKLPSVAERMEQGHLVSLIDSAEQAVATRNFAVELHGLLTTRSPKDTWSLVLILVGTAVSSYGDIPFR